jgi:hypothetical protein
MWEKRIGKDLFVYDQSSDFKVDFIFDERQRAVIDRRVLDRRVAHAKASDRKIRAAANDAETRLQELKAQYDSLLADFELAPPGTMRPSIIGMPVVERPPRSSTRSTGRQTL